jgi:citrate synthase
LINDQHQPTWRAVPGRRLTTAEAALRLGVKPATLYAYVSRGVLARHRGAGGSTFDAVEVERLALGSRRAVARTKAPLAFVTELTLIEDGTLRYRGLDALELSRTRGFEAVAAWLWDGAWPERPPVWSAGPKVGGTASAACAGLEARCPPADRWRVAVAAAATADPLRHDHSPAAVTGAAAGLMAALVEVLPVVGRPARRSRSSLADRLWPRLSPLPATAAEIATLDAALVLMADHELAASTLAARAAAAFGADPYAVVLTGMAAASGPLHAASSLEVRPVLARAELHGAAVALGEVLSRGAEVHGFGQSLYPDGDPRATEILGRLRSLPNSVAAVDGVLALASSRGMPPPNCDFALAALAHVSHMVPGASEAIFVLGRTAGWVAHAMEEYAQRTSFRMRATYVGPRVTPT